MRGAIAALFLGFLFAACVSDVELRPLDSHGRYRQSYIEGEAFAIESGGRRRVLFQSSEINGDRVAPGQSVLMYLSVPIESGKGPDLMDTRAFVVWSDVAAEFSGFLEPLDHKRGREWKNLRGRYRGILREPQTNELKPVEIEVKDAPIVPAQEAPAISVDAYADEIRSHLFRLEFDAADREYWGAKTGPASGETGNK